MIKRSALIIGIDGGTWAVLKPAIQTGMMPCLKGLLDTGASGILESVIPAITPAAWGSFQTGMNPGAQGVYDFNRWNRQKRKMMPVNSTDLTNTLWDILSAAGKRVGVLNVPMTYPPRSINGYMVTGFLTPSLDSDFTSPAQLKAELLREIPNYDILNLEKAFVKPSQIQWADFVESMRHNIDCRARAAEFLIKKEGLDLFMVHFQASDVVQHVLWGYLDETHPLYDSQKQKYIFEHFYKYLDEKIEQVITAFANQASGQHAVFVISDHGFQAHLKKFNLARWLCQEGFMNTKLTTPSKGTPPMMKQLQRAGLGKLIRRFLPSKTVSKIEKTVKLKESRFDIERSSVLMQRSCREGFLFLLQDSEQDRKETEQKLKEMIREIKDDQTGQPVMANVYSKEEIYHGRYLDRMPDLTLVPADGYTFELTNRIEEKMFQNVDFENEVHIGTHHKDGIFVAQGDGIACNQGIHAHITDILWTILHYLQLPISQDRDGQVIENIFTDEFRKTNPIKETSRIEQPSPEASSENVYSNKEQQQIENRLKDLGYL
ncbi:MAG: alkaline phosphatase family protein [Planctomycetes bacterium]|nr:alkaline phosphatase family protein [Planctomycetota bacterium]